MVEMQNDPVRKDRRRTADKARKSEWLSSYNSSPTRCALSALRLFLEPHHNWENASFYGRESSPANTVLTVVGTPVLLHWRCWLGAAFACELSAFVCGWSTLKTFGASRTSERCWPECLKRVI